MENFGLVLCGGGAKGAYQIGALKAIAEYDISFNGFSGSSIGALNEVFYYTNSLDNLIEIWKDVDFADFFSLTEENSILGLSTNGFTGKSFLSAKITLPQSLQYHTGNGTPKYL